MSEIKVIACRYGSCIKLAIRTTDFCSEHGISEVIENMKKMDIAYKNMDRKKRFNFQRKNIKLVSDFLKSKYFEESFSNYLDEIDEIYSHRHDNYNNKQPFS